jgi:hypothetical protein
MPSWLVIVRNAPEASQLLSLGVSKLAKRSGGGFSGISYRIAAANLASAPSPRPRNPKSSVCPGFLRAHQLSIPILTAQSRRQNNHGVL